MLRVINRPILRWALWPDLTWIERLQSCETALLVGGRVGRVSISLFHVLIWSGNGFERGFERGLERGFERGLGTGSKVGASMLWGFDVFVLGNGADVLLALGPASGL